VHENLNGELGHTSREAHRVCALEGRQIMHAWSYIGVERRPTLQIVKL